MEVFIFIVGFLIGILWGRQVYSNWYKRMLEITINAYIQQGKLYKDKVSRRKDK